MSAETAKSSVGKLDLQCKLEKSPSTHSSPYVPRAVAAQGVFFSAHTPAQKKFGGGRSGWTVHACRNSIQTTTVVKYARKITCCKDHKFLICKCIAHFSLLQTI